MTVEEQIRIILDNVPKVYEAGQKAGYGGVNCVTKDDNTIPKNALKHAKILSVENGGAYIRKYNLLPMPYSRKEFDYFIPHEDGTIDVSMKYGNSAWLFNSSSNFYVEPDIYYLSGTTTSFQKLILKVFDGNTEIKSFTASGVNGGVIVNLTGLTYTRLSLKLEWESRGTVYGFDSVYPQLVKGTEGKPFEPYTIKLPCVKKIQVIRKSSGEVICEREIPAAILELSQYQAGNLLSFGDKTAGNDYVILPADETIAGELILTDYVNSLWKQTGKTVTDVSAMIGDFDPFIEIDEDCEINLVTVDETHPKEFCKANILYQTTAVN